MATGGTTGTPIPLTPNYPYHFSLVATTADNRRADGTASTTVYNDNLTLTITGPSGVTFASGGTTKSVSFSSGYAGQIDFVFPPALDGQTVNLNLAVSGATVYGIASTIVANSIPISSTAPFAYHVYGSATSTTNTCQPALVTYEDVSGTARLVQGTPRESAQLINSANNSFTSGSIGTGDPTCASNQNSISGTTTTSALYALNYFKITTNEPTGHFSFSGDYYPGSLTMNVITNGYSATKLGIYGTASPQSGVCTPYMITTEDYAGVSSGATGDILTTLTASGAAGGTFYTNQSCTTTGSSPTIPLTSRAQVIFFKAASAGSFSISVSTMYGMTGQTLNGTAR